MQILSWNLCSHNPNQIWSLQKIIDLDADLYCLQEVSEKSLQYLLSKSEFEVYFALDGEWKGPKTSVLGRAKIQRFYLVIVSKFKCSQVFRRPVSMRGPKSLLARLKKLNKPREMLAVDFEHQNQKYRVCNLHLEMACGPHLRMEQFSNVWKFCNTFGGNLSNENSDRKLIVCGDLNIFARPAVNFLVGPFLGFKAEEYKLFERREFENFFSKYQLQNPFKGTVTYPAFRLQLDYILLPKDMELIDKNLVFWRKESDHKLLHVEVR